MGDERPVSIRFPSRYPSAENSDTRLHFCHRSERDILVEECKEAILTLSSREETFFGPYEMPPVQVKTRRPNKSVEDDEDDDDAEQEGLHEERRPSEEQLEKLRSSQTELKQTISERDNSIKELEGKLAGLEKVTAMQEGR